MEEKDFQRVEQMISKAVSAEVGKVVKAELGSVREDTSPSGLMWAATF